MQTRNWYATVETGETNFDQSQNRIEKKKEQIRKHNGYNGLKQNDSIKVE